MSTLHRWESFWQDKSTPLHRSTPGFYRQHGRELALLCELQPHHEVLEIGCGTGAMFEELGFDRVSYRGVDLSDAMLAEFRSNHPAVDLVRADGASYRDDKKYDLIFSNGVVQYFDRAMLLSHVANAAHMLARGGRLVCGSLPWRDRRVGFMTGALTPGFKRRPVLGRLVALKRSFGGDPMGRWFTLSELEQIAHTCGLEARVVGSMQYLYRFHAVLARRSDA